jgi:hypothetical protein
VIALIRYQLAVLGHSQRYLPPLLVFIALLAMFYSNNSGPALPAFAFTAGTLLIVAGWLTIALIDVEDPVQRTVTRSHTGSMHRLLASVVLVVLLCSTALGVLSVVWAAISHQGRGYTVHDLAVGVLAHVLCASVGIAVALPCSGLVIRRIGYTVISAVALFGIVLLVKWIPLTYPLLLAMSSGTVDPALLLRSVFAAGNALAASLLLVTAWCTRRG